MLRDLDDSLGPVSATAADQLAEHVGFVPDLVPVLSSSDVFISSSIADAGPATILEAMSAGLPVISSRNCGFASMVSEKEDGFTYHYNDVSKLTEILTWFINNPGEIQPMGKRARSKMENLSTGRYAEEILGHIRNLGDRQQQPEQDRLPE